MKKTTLSLLLLLFLVARCDKDPDFPGQSENPILFSSQINEAESMPSEAITRWQAGDQIGVYTEGNAMHRNIPYTTNAAGEFSSTKPIYFPAGEESIDIIAYYPYNAAQSSNTLSINLTTNPQNILYSNNLKGIGASSKEKLNRLDFNHLLQRIYISLTATDASMLSGSLMAYLNGYTQGSLSLSDGTLSLNEESRGIIPLEITGSGNERMIHGVLLFSQGSSVELTFLVNGVPFKWNIPLIQKENYIYTYGVELEEESLRVTTPLTGSNSGEAYILHPVDNTTPPPVIPTDPELVERPSMQIFMETPVPGSGTLSPEIYQVTHIINNLSWLNNSNATAGVRNYTIHYDTEERYPVWVAYPLHPSFLRSGNRTDDWQYAPLLPVAYQPDLFSAWQTRTVSRGHMLPSASRSATRDLNRSTFYFTNMVAQDSEMNGTTWSDLEEKVRYWSKQTEYDTLYVVTGSILPSPPETISYALDASGRNAAIPKYLYKALCRKNKQNGEYNTIAFKMENRTTGIDYINSMLSVEELEQLTGFTFFSKLPAGVATEVKRQKSLSKWY